MIEHAVFGGGCFWCTEAIFQQLKGVIAVNSGYAGGDMENPDYELVSSGETGHAEVIKIEFDPQLIPYLDLVKIFMHTHNPTTRNQQGADIGTQYRSIILYTTPEQKTVAEAFIKEANDSHEFGENPIVTEVKPLGKFYDAEDYHKNYYTKHEDQPYCELIISPKLQKLRQKYASYLKTDS